MKVVIIGGHFTPALAVIEKLPKYAKVVYIGRKYVFEKDKTISLEYQTIKKLQIPFLSLTTGRLQRNFSSQTISSLLKIPYGFWQAWSILKQQKPDAIVGFGGYLSVPVCLAGKILGIPIIIHEQTLEVGLANKVIAQLADKICISWKSSEKFFPKKKTILTGNPLPESMQGNVIASNPSAGKQERGNLNKVAMTPSVCIIGGSSGSHAINLLIEACLPQLLEQFTLIHQTGDAQEFHDYERLTQFRNNLPDQLQKRYTITKFIPPEKILSVLDHADLVVSRCGINTITALLFIKKPSLLIPLPFSQRNEQYKNALLLKDAGIGEILRQQHLTGEKLFDKIVEMFNNKKNYEKKTAQIQETNPFSAAEKIVSVIIPFAQKNT